MIKLNLNARLKFPILVFCNVGIGIQAFIIHTYLFKARIENRKILLINIYDFRPLTTLFKLHKKNNTEIFNLESPYFLFSNFPNIKKVIDILGNFIFFILYVFASINNKILFNKFRIKKEIFQYKNYPSIYNLKELEYFQRTENDIDFWEEVKNTDFSIQLNRAKEKESENKLEKIGLPKGAWYVCVHVRGNFWYQNLENEDIDNLRNTSIVNFHKAFDEITKRGGYVVRIGDLSMDKISSNNPNVIDYAHSKIKTDFTDLYLIKNCKFFLCSMSGPLEVARLFNKPTAVTNIYHSSHWYPQGENCIGIMKKMEVDGVKLSLKTIFENYTNFEPYDFFNWTKLKSNIRYFENSPDEIYDLAVEMFEMLDNQTQPTSLQFSLNKLIEDTYLEILNKDWNLSNDKLSDCNSKYQWFAWNGYVKGRLGNKFILENI